MTTSFSCIFFRSSSEQILVSLQTNQNQQFVNPNHHLDHYKHHILNEQHLQDLYYCPSFSAPLSAILPLHTGYFLNLSCKRLMQYFSLKTPRPHAVMTDRKHSTHTIRAISSFALPVFNWNTRQCISIFVKNTTPVFNFIITSVEDRNSSCNHAFGIFNFFSQTSEPCFVLILNFRPHRKCLKCFTKVTTANNSL